MTSHLFKILAEMENPPKEPPVVEKIREILMLAIPPTLLGTIAAADRFMSVCLIALDNMPWRGGKVGC